MKITIEFQDADDLLRFTSFSAKCHEQDGTPGAMYCGVAASALKRAKVTHSEAAPTKTPEYIAALEAAAAVARDAANWLARSTRTDDQETAADLRAALDKATP